VPAVELPLIAIAVAWAVVRLRGSASPRPVVRRLLALGIAVWLGAHTMIRAWGYYRYGDGWSVFVGHVPLAVVLMWAVAIDSAHLLARRLVATPRACVVLTGVVVGLDAALVEPLAVHAGLWRWIAPGPFGVPPIGVLGWGLFAAAAAHMLLEDEDERPLGTLADALGSVGATHLLVVVAWHAGLHHAERVWPVGPTLAVAWIVAAVLAVLAWRRRGRIDLRLLVVRGPAAVLLFGLLLATAAGPALWAWAAAFALPYGALLAGGAISPVSGSSSAKRAGVGSSK
jgi:hypothetical protein